MRPPLLQENLTTVTNVTNQTNLTTVTLVDLLAQLSQITQAVSSLQFQVSALQNYVSKFFFSTYKSS